MDSTIGHFASYLREWSPRSHGTLLLKTPEIVESDGAHSVIRGDIFETLGDVAADLAYFDPPHGSNNEKMPPSRVRYASYYHLWTTVCLADRPNLFGKVRRRVDTADKVAASVFEDFRKDADGQFAALAAIDSRLRDLERKWAEQELLDPPAVERTIERLEVELAKLVPALTALRTRQNEIATELLELVGRAR